MRLSYVGAGLMIVGFASLAVTLAAGRYAIIPGTALERGWGTTVGGLGGLVLVALGEQLRTASGGGSDRDWIPDEE